MDRMGNPGGSFCESFCGFRQAEKRARTTRATVFRDVENPDQRAANSSRPIPSVAPAVSASPVDTRVGPLFGNLE